MTIPDLREWLRKGDTSKPVAKYALAHGLFEDAIAKYDDWITIGGRPEGGKQHAGGTPVQIDGAGRITKGPAALRNRSLSNVDRNVQRPAASPPPQPQQTEQPAPKAAQQPASQPVPKFKIVIPKVEGRASPDELKKRLASIGMTPESAAAVAGCQEGWTAEIFGSQAIAGGRLCRVRMGTVGDAVVMVREFLATSGGPVLYNSYFEIRDEKLQGRGLGMKIFGQQVDQAVAAGITKIETHAVRDDDGMNGYYTWARFGYDADLERDMMRAPLPQSLSDCKRVSDLMKTKEGRDWWKENGDSFHGTFDLSEGSQSRKVFDAYRQQKAAAASG